MASIPYFSLPTIPLGIVDLQPFGILVASGVLFGSWIGRKRGAVLHLRDDDIRVLVGYLLIFGFIGAHVFDVLWYQRDELRKDPLLLVKVWAGISSYGGFIGATVGYFLFLWRHRPAVPLAVADTVGWGILPGFTIGRLGCTVVHDHPGRATDFFLAIDFPAAVAKGRGFLPGPRHDLGLYEFLYLLVVLAVFWLLTRKEKPVGFAIAFAAISYAPVRFFLEYLRLPSTDPRYAGLTFAQYVSIVTLLVGIATMIYVYRRHLVAADLQPEPQPKRKGKGKQSRSRK